MSKFVKKICVFKQTRIVWRRPQILVLSTRERGGCHWMIQTHVWVGQDYPGPLGLEEEDMNEE